MSARPSVDSLTLKLLAAIERREWPQAVAITETLIESGLPMWINRTARGAWQAGEIEVCFHLMRHSHFPDDLRASVLDRVANPGDVAVMAWDNNDAPTLRALFDRGATVADIAHVLKRDAALPAKTGLIAVIQPEIAQHRRTLLQQRMPARVAKGPRR